MLAAVSITALQVAVLVGCAALRGATFVSGRHLVWFLAAALVFSVLMYAVAELMANRLPSPEAYIGAVPAAGRHRSVAPRRDAVSDHRTAALAHLRRQGSPAHPRAGPAALRPHQRRRGNPVQHLGDEEPGRVAALSLAVVCGYAAAATVAAMRIAAMRIAARRGVQ